MSPLGRPDSGLAPPVALLALLAAALTTSSLALDNGLARTPPMGWLAWTRFTCETDCASFPDDCINERLFRQMAERLSADGWAQLGYRYLNVDDCWSEREREAATERLVADRARFPAGIGPLAGHAHGLGLRLGLYGDCGLKTCAGYPAQLRPIVAQTSNSHELDNYFQVDAQALADWQVDSFKFDGCHIDPLAAERICPGMSAALNATGRQVLLVCEWPFYMMYAHAEPDFELAGSNCNVWRYFDDIEDSWLSVLNTIDYTVKHQSTMVKFHGPGHWFDPDQLVIGNFGLSLEQARAQMAIWCIWAAPLYMGNDLRHLEAGARKILQNRHLIRVDQDQLGVMGLMVAKSSDGDHLVFVKPVLPISARTGCPSFALVYLNRATLGNAQKVSFKLADLLLAAPINQAAKHQLALGAQGPPIQVAKCLGSIRFGVRAPRAGNGRPAKVTAASVWAAPKGPAAGGEPPVVLEFEAYDLFADAAKLSLGGSNGGGIAPSDRLELLVRPSSVRAIRLEERQLDEPANGSQAAR